MSDNPLVAAEQGAKSKVARIGPYLKAHWKELLALTFAAIPALFIVFHKGSRAAAQQAISYPAQLFGGPGGATPGTPAGPSGGGDPSTSIPTPPPAQPASQSGGSKVSVNGYNPTLVAVPSKGGSVPPPPGPPPPPPPPRQLTDLPQSVQRQASLQRPKTTTTSPGLLGSIGASITANAKATATRLAAIKVAPPPPPPPPPPAPSTYGKVSVTGGSPASIRNQGLEG